jgi:hypothetical protein
MFLVTFMATAALAQSVTFDQSLQLPAGWTSGVTGQGAAKWEVVADGAAASSPNVLRQTGEATFCWAVDSKQKIQDGFVETQIKPISGKEDQAGGLVWRFKDANNYYVVRANALEGNVVLYKTVNGKRSSLQIKGRMFGYGVDTPVPRGKWSTLRVDFKGSMFSVTFNGKKLFDVEDDSITGAGAVGLWTKADSVTLFDNISFGSSEP